MKYVVEKNGQKMLIEASHEFALQERMSMDGFTVIGPAEEHEEDLIEIKNMEKLDSLRILRQPKINEADILINIAHDNNQDLTNLKAYRQALRDVTEAYKDDLSLLTNMFFEGGEAKWSNVVDEETVITPFSWPTKPN